MRIRVRRRLTPTVGLGPADHQLLARLRAVAILLNALDEGSDWGGEILLHLRDDGQFRVLGSLPWPVALHIANTAGIALDCASFDTYSYQQRLDLTKRIHREAADALLPSGLPPGLAHLLHQLAIGAPVPDTLAAAVEGAGWVLNRRSPILWPNLDDDISAHELLEQVAASGILDPEGAALLGPLARFVAEAVARLTGSGG